MKKMTIIERVERYAHERGLGKLNQHEMSLYVAGACEQKRLDEPQWEKLTPDNEEELYEAVEKNDAVVLAHYLDDKFQYLTQDCIVDTIHTQAKRGNTYYLIVDKPKI